ncbi:helix-turn-helix domain-containing protein [Pseudonocardia sp. CA-107938]|uniref:helix-turn-helix domain-containing protein n=1 Tax=Pseudonocardia sp. CA-107938 TaxID=3240021 RepID=UPI003D936BAA
MPQQIPTTRRLRLARDLRRLREQAGVSREQVMELLDCDPAKVSRIESGKQGVSAAEARVLLGLYKVDDPAEQDRILTLVREARKRDEIVAVPSYLRAYVSLEAEAVEIKVFQIDLIPAMLQTERYIRAIAAAHDPTQSPTEVEQLVAIRRERQSRLFTDNPPTLWVVLTEAAVRTLAGDSDVMREQLARVLEMAELPHVSVRMIPFAAGPHASMGMPFLILRLAEPEGAQVVYLEDRWSADYLDKPKQTSAYAEVFDRLCTSAMDEQATRTAINGVMKELP